MINAPLNLRTLFTIKNFIVMMIGVLCAAFALKGFMIPNHFLDGGVTGIALLIHESIHIPFGLVFLLLNLLFLVPASSSTCYY
jgi:uncharacterized membrane-anchored protein YitT (DUF2179 family)